MTISYVSVGSTADHTNTVTPSLPSGFAAGQLAILQVVSGHPSDSIPSTPSGWTLAGTFSGGGGTFASAAGPRRLTYFVRELVAGDRAPTTSIPSGATGSVIGAYVYTLARSAGTGWRWAFTAGQDTTNDTPFSAACGSAVTFRPGDFIVLGWGLANSVSGPGSPGVTATGITFDVVSTHANAAIASGFGARNAWRHTVVTAGTATQAPTVTATLTAASVGVGAVLRVREATTDLSVTAQSVFPPRNLLSITGLAAEDIVSVTINRQVGGSQTPVRAASDVDVTGQNALVRVDGEQPLGVALDYEAVMTDVNGAVWRIYSQEITSVVDSDVISDAVRGIGAAVVIQSWPAKKRDRDASVFNVGGRIVVVSRPRSAAQATVTVRTLTAADGDALQTVLDAATEGVVLIRKQVAMEGVDGHLAVVSDTEDRRWFDELRFWQLDTYETEPWPDSLEAAGFTLQDIANNYSSLQDLADAFTPGSLLDIALYDFGG
ncbi:hypothetical protein [Streptomyces sp. NPDC003299]